MYKTSTLLQNLNLEQLLWRNPEPGYMQEFRMHQRRRLNALTTKLLALSKGAAACMSWRCARLACGSHLVQPKGSAGRVGLGQRHGPLERSFEHRCYRMRLVCSPPRR